MYEATGESIPEESRQTAVDRAMIEPAFAARDYLTLRSLAAHEVQEVAEQAKAALQRIQGR